jgi:hypothetical protein
MRLTPSATASWLLLVVTLNWMFEAKAQRDSARRAARTTCAPVARTCAGGLLSEVESATVMFVTGHLTCVVAAVLVNWSV